MVYGEEWDPILQRARALIDARLYDEAIFELSLAPESAGVHALLGEIFLRKHRHREAEEHFRRAAELRPNDAEILNGLGLAVSHQRGRRREAIEILGRAAQLDPSHPAVRENLHENARHWVYYAGLVASWVIFRMIRTAWMEEQWQGAWSPLVIGAWSAVVVAAALLVIRRRRRSLPGNAQTLLAEVARRTRASRRRNAIFDGGLFVAFFLGMLWAIERYEPLQNSIGLRAAMFFGLLALGFAAAKLFRRVTGSIED